LVYGLLLLASIGGGLRSQHRKLEAKKAQVTELKEQVERRTQEFKKQNDGLRAINNQLRESCLRDPLTGLHNRRYLDEFLNAETAFLERSLTDIKSKGRSQDGVDLQPKMFFIMLDLDGFKLINDDYGHHAGDQALLQVCDILRKCARRSDHIIRWGGDEFLVVGRCGGPLGAEKLAERVRSEIQNHRFELGNGHESRLSASIGLSLYPFVPAAPSMVKWGQVIDIADQASYLAKKTKKGAWVEIYSTEKTARAEPVRTVKMDVEQLLRRGIVEVKTSIEGDFEAAVAASERRANRGLSEWGDP
jgi:diguanylate cyclase (GGDEF)-like protein